MNRICVMVQSTLWKLGFRPQCVCCAERPADFGSRPYCWDCARELWYAWHEPVQPVALPVPDKQPGFELLHGYRPVRGADYDLEETGDELDYLLGRGVYSNDPEAIDLDAFDAGEWQELLLIQQLNRPVTPAQKRLLDRAATE